MKKLFIPGQHSSRDFQNALEEMAEEGLASVLILAADGTKFPTLSYDPILQSSSLKITGGIFPEILFEGIRYQEGTIMVGFRQKMNTVEFSDLTLDYVRDKLEEAFSGVDPVMKTIFVFVDAFAHHKTNLTDMLYNSFGTLPNYIGGGAGSLNFEGMPCLFTNHGLLQHGASVSIIDLTTSIGVSHGWQVISEPLKVTEAEHNRMKSLEWRPAMDIYREVIRAHSKKDHALENFFEMTQSYAFGISKLGGEMVVRDPFKEEDGAVFTLDNIEQGSHVHILYGDQEGLLSGARKARDLALRAGSDNRHSEFFIIDCISRVLFMDNDFNQEIQNLDPENQGFGAFTLGEIANNGECYLEIFNKTAVVCKLNESK